MRYLGLIGLLVSSLTWADHKISLTVDGIHYYCGAGGSGGTDPLCVRKVAAYCDSETSYTSNQCFDKATTGCQSATTAEYATCVVDMAKYCDDNTTLTSNQCFDKALSACQGTRASLMDLLEGVKTSASNRR